MTKFDLARRVCAACALLLGVAHLGVSFLIYPELSLDGLWFVGAGLAMIVTALSNLPNNPVTRMGGAALMLQNALMLAYFIAVLTIFPGMQVVVGLVLFTALTLLAVPRMMESPETA